MLDAARRRLTRQWGFSRSQTAVVQLLRIWVQLFVAQDLFQLNAVKEHALEAMMHAWMQAFVEPRCHQRPKSAVAQEKLVESALERVPVS
jgi:hypothetical protein